MKKMYQIAVVRMDLGFGIMDVLCGPIEGFKMAIRALDAVRAGLMVAGRQPSEIYRHAFLDGKKVYRLLEVTDYTVRKVTVR